MTTGHVIPLLGAYVLGALDEHEVSAVEQHLPSCQTCQLEAEDLRGVAAALGEAPPEALIEGPPPDADLLLQRTLRQVRAERGRRDWRGRAAVATAAVVVSGVVLGGGAVLGRSTASRPEAGPPPPPVTGSVPTPVLGTKFGSGADPVTGARLTVAVRPAAGWVRLNASVTGIAAGQRCRLLVVAGDGTRREAGSWLVSEAGAAQGTNLDGSALVAPDEVAAVEVENFQGRKLVSVPV